jgi:hypothetical protein
MYDNLGDLIFKLWKFDSKPRPKRYGRVIEFESAGSDKAGHGGLSPGSKKFIENLESSEALALDKTLRNCIEAVIDHMKAKLPRQILEICK